MTRKNITLLALSGACVLLFLIGSMKSSSNQRKERRAAAERLEAMQLVAESKINAIVAEGKLSTVDVTLSKVVKASHPQNFSLPGTIGSVKIGERKILYSCSAHIEAGVDMKNYNPSLTAIDPETKSINITLPKVEYLVFDMREERPVLEYEETSGLASSFSAEDKIKIKQQAEIDIRKKARDMGILQEAEQKTRSFFESFLQNLGYQNITIDFE